MRVTFLLLVLILSGCAIKGHVYKHISPAETVKLCLIGDTGTGWEVQKKTAQMLEKERCSSIHFLGDVVYDSGINSATDPEFKTKFYDFYYRLSEMDLRPRLYVILGNHDHKGSMPAWQEISQKYNNIIFPSPWYLVKLNDLCVVHLDSNYYVRFWRYPIGVAQKDWLKETENLEMKDCSKKIALMHHPYDNRGKSHGPSKGRIRNFQDEYIVGRYDFLISGHEHFLSDEGVKKGTHLLISGAGGKPYKGEDAGYLVLNWNRKTKEISYEFRRLPK